MKILYGANSTYIDVTDKVLETCVLNNAIVIPYFDLNRAQLFSDPLYGVVKQIIVYDDYGNTIAIHDNVSISFPILPNKTIDVRKERHRRAWWETVGKHIADPADRLNTLQTYIVMPYGTFTDEYPEQFMAIQFIKPENKVLEIGSNIGRNTCIIASILDSETNLVSLECDPDTVNKLVNVRNMNNFHFHIEPSALSERPLIQRGWDTKVLEPNQVIPEGWKQVQTITWESLTKKYPIPFDTLVADCEGALNPILKDRPEVLTNIKTIIVENDYKTIQEYKEVEEIFIKHGFSIVYSAPLNAFHMCCYPFFYQVWKRE